MQIPFPCTPIHQPTALFINTLSLSRSSTYTCTCMLCFADLHIQKTRTSVPKSQRRDEDMMCNASASSSGSQLRMVSLCNFTVLCTIAIPVTSQNST